MGRVGTDIAVLASGSVVLGALAVMIRAVFRVAITIRDNTSATQSLTTRLDGLSVRLDGEFAKLEKRVTALERRRPRALLGWAGPAG